MRNKFDAQLALLNQEMIAMGALCENAIDSIAEALLEGDMAVAERAIQVEDEIDQKERDIESLCLKLLLQQQPVARDLRQISAALKMITDMERIGDQAQDIAEIIKAGAVFSTAISQRLAEMAKATVRMVTGSVDAYVKKDLQLAEDVMDYDDVVDSLFDKIKKELLEMIVENQEQGECALDVLMIAKYFERIGDHASNIASWVRFSITGLHEKGEIEG